MALMKKRDRLFVATNLGPAVLCFLVIFAYPLLRTILMSFYKIPAMSSPMSQWEFPDLIVRHFRPFLILICDRKASGRPK